MSQRAKIGVDNFRQGFNCAQSVLLAFEDLVNIDKNTLLNIGVALGGGFARTRNLCGAVNAMGIVYGLVVKPDKAKAYAEMQDPINEIKSIFGSINCCEMLKGVSVTSGFVPQERTETYYATRPCEKVVEKSILALEKILYN